VANSYVPYLRKVDYSPIIQNGQLSNQLLDPLNAGTNQRIFAETWAIGKIYESIEQRFDLAFEITPTLPYDYYKTYYAGDRVCIDFDEWVAPAEETSYLFGNCVIKNDIGYFCVQPNNSATFRPEDWVRIGKKDDVYYIPYPYPIFRLEPEQQRGIFTAGYYKKDDKVWWANKVWTAKQETVLIDDAAYIQFQYINNIPPANTFPNAKGGDLFWTDDGEYSFTGTLEEPNYPSIGVWKLGDNRNAILVSSLIDLSLWRLHSRISPQNIPALRESNKNATFQWLKDIKDGRINLDIEPLQPQQGLNLTWGSKPKYISKY